MHIGYCNSEAKETSSTIGFAQAKIESIWEGKETMDIISLTERVE